MSPLEILQAEIVACERCPRLRSHCADVGVRKRRAYADWDYWAKPVPSFGDPNARMLIVGLAPGAHGSNRTGRMFTGDASGDFLYRALYDTGFATQPTSVAPGDGLALAGAYITAAAHCAPPGNKPTPEEIAACRTHLEREFALLTNVRVMVALGRIAFDACLGLMISRGWLARRAGVEFAHDREHRFGAGAPLLISSYHPSQQNTSTGRLTAPMLRSVFKRARRRLALQSPA